MFVVNDHGGKPIKTWLGSQFELPPNCREQAQAVASLPFIHKHLALMPDTHYGFGVPIGAVVACDGVVIPAAVGVDIGCFDRETELKAICSCISRNIPTGFCHHKEPQTWTGFETTPRDCPPVDEQIQKATYQLGTLGGGNHFIELQENTEGNLCFMLHSGSRNFGLQIANYYIGVAEALNRKWYSVVDPKAKLAFLPVDADEGVEYIAAMNFALEFARENRNRMMEVVKNIAFNLIKKHTGITNIGISAEINIQHNYAAVENHFGNNVWIHRKGAIRMREGEVGIIPESMGTPSYIVRGRGERESFCSASHGAGRAMGRKEAEREFTADDVQTQLDDAGVISVGDAKDFIDECPLAYKDIDAVIANEQDLVEVMTKLKPVASVKGA